MTSSYRVSSVDDQGHESGSGAPASGTPRPDFHGEVVYDYLEVPGSSGFRFAENETANPIVDGDDPSRHVRLEEDDAGWWLVPGPGTRLYPQGFVTTALKCGVAADADCTALEVAPTSGYATQDVFVETQTTYVMQVVGDDGQVHYGVLRVEMLGFDQFGPLAIFDWAYQLQAGNPELTPRPGPTR